MVVWAGRKTMRALVCRASSPCGGRGVLALITSVLASLTTSSLRVSERRRSVVSVCRDFGTSGLKLAVLDSLVRRLIRKKKKTWTVGQEAREE